MLLLRTRVARRATRVRGPAPLLQLAQPTTRARGPLHVDATSSRHVSAFGVPPTSTPRCITTKSTAPPPPPPPPPLPAAKTVRVGDDCSLEYIDLQPAIVESATTNTTTLVLLHGAPGTYRDFRHLIPLLRQRTPSTRIVAINFPGFGGSHVDETRYVELLNAQRAAALTLRALQQVVARDARVVLVGHSFGGHAVLTLAAMNATATASSSLCVAGMVLLAAAGTRPHRVLRPRLSAMAIHALQSSPPFVQQHVLARIIKTFYTKVLGFSSDYAASHYVAGVVRAGTTDFAVIRDHVETLRTIRMPSLSAWSRDDAFMEDAIPIALAAALRSDTRLAFQGAGHNLQKTRAPELADEIAAWVQRLESRAIEGVGVQHVAIETRP